MTDQTVTMSNNRFQVLLQSFHKANLSVSAPKHARSLEDHFRDVLSEMRPIEEKKTKICSRCVHCKAYGHVVDGCQKLAIKSTESAESSKPLPAIKESPTTSKAASPSPSLSCFGCSTPGYIRSKCPKCNTVTAKSINFSVFSAGGISPRNQPVLFIDVFDAHRFGIVNTGAKQSVASKSLYRIVERNKQRFVNDRALVKLSDGSNSMQDILTTTVDVRMVDRVIQTKFIVLPYAQVQLTLLSIDFIQDEQIVLDAARGKTF
ncbi:hypothetical protein FQA39_LY14385 [Lamprigera yunnana]|nr:hypothetical protein FQA39_LY14385 [Lamprigera yunnana]